MKKKITFSNVIYLLLGISLIYHTFLTILFFVQYHTTPMRKIGRLMNGVIILILVVWFLYYYVIKKEKDKVNSVLKKYMIKENMFLLLFFLWIYFGCFRKMIVSGSIFMGGNSLYLITVGIKLFLAFLCEWKQENPTYPVSFFDCGADNSHAVCIIPAGS